jgi:dihydroneopterin aldolase
VEFAVASSFPANSHVDYKLACSVGQAAATVRRNEEQQHVSVTKAMENVPTQSNESNSSHELPHVLYITVHISKPQTPNNARYVNMHIKHTSENVEAKMGKSHPGTRHKGPEGE